MKITSIAARLRKVAVDMEIKATLDGDWDFPDEFVLSAVCPYKENLVRSAAVRRLPESP
jgi:hypothetical protein